ncbi:MAG: NIF family HAD-type phosphatase [Clostridia bacterium]
MDKIKKVIILDLDETLEHGIYQSRYDVGNQMTMVLRPNLDILLNKLHEVKKQGIDIILCTTARNIWVDKFLKLIPEFKNAFDKIYSRDNENEWRYYNKDIYSLENKAQNENINLENMKPITTFGYDSILFVDDNKIEELRLKMLFEMADGKLQKDVTFFTGFGFYGGVIQWDKMLMYKKMSKQDLEFYKILNEYLEVERNNPGCNMICSVIDKFIKKDLIYGLNIVDDEYSKEYDIFNNKLNSLKVELEKLSNKFEEKDFKYTTDELEKYICTDRKYPYEDTLHQ